MIRATCSLWRGGSCVPHVQMRRKHANEPTRLWRPRRQFLSQSPINLTFDWLDRPDFMSVLSWLSRRRVVRHFLNKVPFFFFYFSFLICLFSFKFLHVDSMKRLPPHGRMQMSCNPASSWVINKATNPLLPIFSETPQWPRRNGRKLL